MTTTAPKRTKNAQLTGGAPAGGYSLERKIAQANRWRESYNPLRGLTLRRAVSLLEAYYRGEMADLQWTYFFIEQTDPDLFALAERRSSAICSLDWDIKLIPERKRGASWDEKLANEQAAALREAYDRVDNFYDAVEHCAMATFRGFAHLEKHRADDGGIKHLEPLDQWNVVRDGLRGQWKYNPDAKPTTFAGISDDNLIDPTNWIIREPKRHVNRIGLIKFIRQNLSQKDWDAFIEIYGIPGVIIIGPPNIPQDKEASYESAAKSTAEGGSGYLPYGSSVHSNDGPRGVNPFRDHLKFLQEQLILVGTGGLLTMLTQSGSGTLAGSAHQETFDLIARAEAKKISERFQRDLDSEVLLRHFPDQPVLAYFDLAGGDQVDPSEVIDQVQKLSIAGYRVDPAVVSEKAGYKLVEVQATEPGLPPGQPQPGNPARPGLPPFRNRGAAGDPTQDALRAAAQEQLAKAVAEDFQGLAKRLERIQQIEDPELRRTKLQALHDELPQILKDINADPASAKVFANTFGAALLNGVAAGAAARKDATQ